ncbi:MAG: hypothetical protein ACWGON_11190 [Gemmatimonadota bacterium]
MLNRLIFSIAVLSAAALLIPNRASAQQSVPTTVTVGQGRTVAVGGQSHAAGKKGQVPPGWQTRDGRPNDLFLVVDGHTVGMATSAGPEGNLSRVHVDAPAGSDMTVVIGFYTQIASQTAIDTQETYECMRCGSVLVCSVRPTCEE